MAARWRKLVCSSVLVFVALFALVSVAVALPTGGSVSGVVRDSQSTAVVPAAQVELWDWAGGLDPVATTTAGALGDYSFSGIAPGTYEVWAGTDSYFWGSATTTFTVTTNETFTRDIALDPIPDLSGTVYDQGTNPVAGVSVTAWGYDASSSTYYECGWAQADANGAYRIADIGTGEYYLTFDAKGYFSLTYPNAGYQKFSAGTPVAVGATDLTGVDAHMKAATGTQCVHLQFVDVDARSLIRWGDFKLIAPDGTTYQSGLDYDFGTATLYVPCGEYEMWFYRDEYVEHHLGHLTVASAFVSGTFGLHQVPPTIAGRVSLIDGSPASGTTVTAYELEAGSWVPTATAVTGGDGSYIFWMVDGVYRVGVSTNVDYAGTLYSPMFWSGATSLAQATDITAGHDYEASGIDLTLDTVPIAVTGKVVQAASPSTPISGATVELVVPDGTGVKVIDTTSSAYDGSYSFQAAYGSPIQVRVAKTGYITQVAGLETFVGTTLVKDFALAAPDTTAPSLTAQVVGNNTSRVQLTFGATDTGGIPTISYTIDGGVPIVYVGTFTFPYPGTHTVVVTAVDPSGNKATRTLTFTVTHTLAVPVRVAGANRYDVSVNLASTLKPSLAFADVIVACGEDRAMADPLGAAALAAAYDCPVLLTPSAKANPGTVATIKAMAAANGGRINIHVVGGTSSIPAAVYNALSSAKGAGTIERINGANRYDLAYQIAARTKAVLESKGKSCSGVIVVNIENPASFNDALAASPISARAHMPLIGVKGAIVPAEAYKALALFPSKPRYALNSTYLTPNVRNATGCGVVVTSSGNREVAAVDIAKWGVANKFVSYKNTGLANKLSDALPAGGVIGQFDGVMLYTSASPLSATTSSFLPAIKGGVDTGWVFGGTATISDATAAQYKAVLQ